MEFKRIYKNAPLKNGVDFSKNLMFWNKNVNRIVGLLRPTSSLADFLFQINYFGATHYLEITAPEGK